MIEFLEWDSIFFKKKIGKLDLDKSSISFPSEIHFKEYDLVYVFSDNKLEKNLNLVDIKINYRKTTSTKDTFTNVLKFNSLVHSYDKLLDLVFESGQDSRFLKDEFFSINDYRRLYKKWIDKSLTESQAEVLIYTEDNVLMGFISFKRNRTHYTIELIAVDSKARGKGIGKKLLNMTENIIGANKQLTVATQETNKSACLFYQNYGFNVLNRKYIYHYAPNTIQ